MSDMHFGLILPGINFYVWFDISINQEKQFKSFPPCFNALINPYQQSLNTHIHLLASYFEYNTHFIFARQLYFDVSSEMTSNCSTNLLNRL